MEENRTSYKSVVCEEPSGGANSQRSALDFKNLEDVLPSIQQLDDQVLTCVNEEMTLNKLTFLHEFADYITLLTNEIREYYGFRGLANDLKVSDVIDCIDKSVMIDIKEDTSFNDNSSEEDECL